jgi:type VI secretion system secreted protein Hcp
MALTFQISVKGAKQGQFKGDNPSGKMIGLSFETDVTSPRDVATGQASGKRQHKPVRIIKAWGPASPQFYEALVTNELLTEVLLEFVQKTPQGIEQVFFSFKLINAALSGFRQYTGPLPGSTADFHELEEIDFVFQKIELQHLIAKTSAADTWQV